VREGETVNIPANARHAFRNASDRPPWLCLLECHNWLAESCARRPAVALRALVEIWCDQSADGRHSEEFAWTAQRRLHDAPSGFDQSRNVSRSRICLDWKPMRKRWSKCEKAAIDAPKLPAAAAGSTSLGVACRSGTSVSLGSISSSARRFA